MALRLRMDLNLQLGSEETAAQPQGKEDLGLSLRTLSHGVKGCTVNETARTPGTHLEERPGQTEPVSKTLKLPLIKGTNLMELSGDVGVECWAQGMQPSLGPLLSHGQSGPLALVERANREIRGSWRSTWPFFPS